MQTSDYDNLLWLESVLVVETPLHQSAGCFPKESEKYIEGGSNNSMHHRITNIVHICFIKMVHPVQLLSTSRRVDLSLQKSSLMVLIYLKSISISKINLHSRFTGN